MAVLVLLALYSDIKSYKIKNIVVYPFMAAGVLTNLLLSGINGAAESLLAVLLPVLLLIVLFALRMLGAGDIKLFSAIGAIMGPEFVLYTMAWSFISGGMISLFIIIVRKNGVQRLKHLYNYIKCCILTLSIHPYTNFSDKSDGGKFRFAYAILCGTAIMVISGL